MKPPLAALVAGPFALLGLLLGLFFGGIAHWLVALLGGLVGLAWLAPWVQAAVIVAAPPVTAGLAYYVLAHGLEPALTAALAGVALGALLGALVLVLGFLGWAPALALLALGGAALGALAAVVAGPRPRSAAPQA